VNKHEESSDKSEYGFIPLGEFPVSRHFYEEVLRLTEMARQGECTEMDDMLHELMLEEQRRCAFPSPEELAALPSWKSMLRAGSSRKE